MDFKKIIIFFSLITFIFLSCKSGVSTDNKKSNSNLKSIEQTKDNNITKLKDSNKIKLTKKEFWNKAEAELNLKTEEVTSLKEVIKKFNSAKKSYKKSKKWEGETKKRTFSNRTKEVKLILGNKYDKWLDYNKKYSR